ncbi:putative RNA-directed DNA polymerase from transposon BS [Caerostris darwini]|uniref:RNA-directed DNA polymerase from transposon BS n=1 Tax=Caerostris darwini TaxID=1538125 RepID=A0AAV4TID9_9ARAC|nr:putative RNA-directed DNA polymerase from transposon BS [Caerostris darwini]
MEETTPKVYSCDEVLSNPFEVYELDLALKCLKVKNSLDEDYIHAEFLNNLREAAKRTILKAFNHIWKRGLVTSLWRKTTIIPVLKKNKDFKLLSSYRPISLTSITGKTMERLLINRLNWSRENNNSLS